MDQKEIEARAKAILYELGFSPDHKGFKLIVTAVRLIVEDPDTYEHKFATILYRKLAEIYGITFAAAENFIRKAIESSFDKAFYSNYELAKAAYTRVFGNTCDLVERPTNKLFVSTITDRVLDEYEPEGVWKPWMK